MDTSRNTPRRNGGARHLGPGHGSRQTPRHAGSGGSAPRTRIVVDLTADTSSEDDSGPDSESDSASGGDTIDSIFGQIAPSATHVDSDIDATPTRPTSGSAITAHFQNNLKSITWVRKPAPAPVTPSKSSAAPQIPHSGVSPTPLVAALGGNDNKDHSAEDLRDPKYPLVTMRTRARRSRQNSQTDDKDDLAGSDELHQAQQQEQQKAKAAAEMQLRCMSPGTADRLASADQDPSFRTPPGKPLSRDPVVRAPMVQSPHSFFHFFQQFLAHKCCPFQRRAMPARFDLPPTRSRSVSPSRPPRSKNAAKASRPASSISGAPAGHPSTPANLAHRPPYPTHAPPPLPQGTPISTPMRPPLSAAANQPRPITCEHDIPSTPAPQRTQPPNPTPAAATPQIVIRKNPFLTPAPAPQPALSIRERLAQQYNNSVVQLGVGSTASARRPAYQPVPIRAPGTPIGIPSAQELLQSRTQNVPAPPGTPLAVPGMARNMANMTPVPAPRFGPPPVFGTPGASRTPFGGAGGVPGGGQFLGTPMRQPFGNGGTEPGSIPADKAGLLRLMQDVMPEDLMNEFKANPWSQPESLKTTLLPHQVLGVRWMMKTESTLGGGILADDMGLGKTMQSITLMLANPPEDDLDRQRTTLVVAPVSLLAQWEAEIKEHVHPGTLKVLVHNGPNRTKQARVLRNYDVTNMAMFEVDWHRIILDEGHRIRNDSTKSSKHCMDLRARYRWILTGTPLQNSADELFSYFKFLRCPAYPTKPSWVADFGKGTNPNRSPAAVAKLRELLKRYVLRRSKDLVDLPDKLIVQEMLDLSPAERAFYDQVQGAAKKAAEKASNMSANRSRMAFLALLLRMRQAVLHPELVKCGSDTEAPEMDWSVGEPAAATAAPVEEEANDGDDLDDLLANMSVMFGDMSLDLSLDDDGADDESGSSSRNRPPKPRQLSTVIEPEGVTMAGARCVKEHVIVEPPVGRPRHDHESTKVLRALQILRSPHKLNPRTKQPKTILFSQFTSLLAVMARALKSEKIGYLMYDGKLSQIQRKQVLEQFRTDPSITVLLMSLQCGSVGLNLTCASRVILFDPWWNPQIEFQAMDRVHRLGQTHPVAVHKLGILDSVEERIFNLQDRKRALADEALGNVERDQDGNMVMPSAQLSNDELVKLVMG
ncbi:SNF2 family N-terminal domain-domain-containing protein [Catenaria anguillulae PL171]|uniref:SNF2 family N-terminal domain-domain-containing protein n=1 Tax=Catenaria anguillulae PL171 TaxID=765915 RepID=A0A1Y2HU01_9FUNG|nr:SNF2 family N-terminal domain-domain-containing protein [Catenaria anguillulae PL171]